MLNRKPIFLLCFSRGGSNIFWNIFLSHPEVCSPIKETLQIFGAGMRHHTLAGYRVALSSRQPRLFNQWNLEERRPVSQGTQELIDRTFYRWKLTTVDDPEMRYKDQNNLYTPEEIEHSRLCAKNNNGLAFLSDILLEMYPQACFFALVRHPFALYEGHKRHAISNSPAEFAEFYRRLAERMIVDSQRFARYHIIRFEDILENPLGAMKQSYRQAGLEFEAVDKIRLKAKEYLHADGKRYSDYEVGKHYWFGFDQLNQIIDPAINVYQSHNLTNQEKDAIRSLADSCMAYFDYA